MFGLSGSGEWSLDVDSLPAWDGVSSSLHSSYPVPDVMFETENQIAEPSLSDPFMSGYNDPSRSTCNLSIGPTDSLPLLEENIFPTVSTSMSESSTPMTLSASSETSAPFSRSQSQVTWSFNETASSPNKVSTPSSTISKEPVLIEPKQNLSRPIERVRLPFACKNPRCDAQFVEQKQLE